MQTADDMKSAISILDAKGLPLFVLSEFSVPRYSAEATTEEEYRTFCKNSLERSPTGRIYVDDARTK